MIGSIVIVVIRQIDIKNTSEPGDHFLGERCCDILSTWNGFSVESLSEEKLSSLADVAVVSGHAGTASLREGSSAIRSALQAIESDEIDRAMQAIESIRPLRIGNCSCAAK